MKRRSFIALALAALGVKFVPKAEPPAQSWEQIYDTPYSEWPSEWPAQNAHDLEKFMELRMDRAGEYAREQIARELWNTTRGHWEL